MLTFRSTDAQYSVQEIHDLTEAAARKHDALPCPRCGSPLRSGATAHEGSRRRRTTLLRCETCRRFLVLK